jgi:uncharacterized repeat protein (TIGR01451 family)
MGSAAKRAMSVLTGALLVVPLVAAPGAAQVPAGEADYGGFANGAVIHAEALERAEPALSDPVSPRVVDAEVAFSAAAVESTGLPAQQTTEWGGTFQPAATAEGDAVEGQSAYGRGYALDASLEQEGQQQGQITAAGLAEAVAPPPSGLVVTEGGPVPGDPIAYASLIRGEAQALIDDIDGCISLGDDLAYGKGLAADAQLLDQDATPDEEGGDPQLEQPVLATEAENPEREVSSSMSHVFLAPQTDAEGASVGDALAVVSETRQTIAPVTLFQGTENAVTFEFLGEWVLRAVATGVPGSARVHYGPGDVSPETPVLRVIQPDATETILTLQDLLSEEGVTVDASPLVSISLGEDPRAIGGDVDSTPEVAGDGTSASAAVDVVRVRLLSEPETGEASELRIGHMEVSATVPAGGIDCPLPISKTVDEPEVAPGDTFTYTITVDNDFQCPLTDVRIVDRITASDGVTWSVTGTDPEAASTSDDEIVWEGLGPIAPGESLSVTATVAVGDDSAAGVFRDEASATATCDGGPVSGRTDVVTAVDLVGTTVLEQPRVVGPALPVGEVAEEVVQLPRTGGGLALAGLGLLGVAGAMTVHRRRHLG